MPRYYRRRTPVRRRYSARPRRPYIRGRGNYVVGRPYVQGHGSYSMPGSWSSLRPLTKGFAPAAGGYIGGGLGALGGTLLAPGIGSTAGYVAGQKLGRAAGKLFSKITGWGDYNIHSNSLIASGGKMLPTFGQDEIRVKHRECVAHLDATTAFQNNVFPMNPGLSDSFPWLSAIANNYEQYRWNGVVYQFKSNCSNSIASTTNLGLGQVILATDYNAHNKPFVNQIQMLGSMFSNSDKPSRDILHAIECAPADMPQKLYYVRSGDIPPGTDARLYDMAVFQIATSDMGADYSGMGQLWVTYDVTFKKSVMNNQLGFDINTDKITPITPSNAAPWGALQAIADGSNLGMTFNSAGTIAYFPPTIESGYYLLDYFWQGTGAVVPALTFAYTNCTQIESWGAGTASDTVFHVSRIIRINARDASITLSAANLPTGTITANFTFTQVNGEIYVS